VDGSQQREGGRMSRTYEWIFICDRCGQNIKGRSTHKRIVPEDWKNLPSGEDLCGKCARAYDRICVNIIDIKEEFFKKGKQL
jgi:hypothetical protein